MYTPRFFASEFWVCFRILGLFRTFHAHPTMLNDRPRFVVSELWVCLRVLGLFRTSHAHTTMLNAHPTIFCYRVLSLLSSFSFVWIDLTRCTKKKLNFSIPTNFRLFKANAVSLESSSFVHYEYCIFK